MQYKAVIFDLDGTLINSSSDIASAINYVSKDFGGRELSGAEVAPLLGEGSKTLVRKALELANADLAVAKLDEIHKAYSTRYRQFPAEATYLYDYVPETLELLHGKKIPLGICTNKSQSLTETVLSRLHVDHYFDGVVGADAVEKCKPDPQHLQECMRLLGVSAQETLYIGDSEIDSITARAADCDYLIVSWAPEDVTGKRLESFDKLFHLIAP